MRTSTKRKKLWRRANRNSGTEEDNSLLEKFTSKSQQQTLPDRRKNQQI